EISSADIQTRGSYNSAASAVRLAEGNAREALATAEQVLADRRVSGLTAQNVKLAFLHAVEAALVLGDAKKADEVLSIVEHEPPGLRAPFLTAMARRFRARLSGDGAIAEYEFKAAMAQLTELELPFYCAVVQLEYGKWLAAQGRDEAAELLSDARDTFE